LTGSDDSIRRKSVGAAQAHREIDDSAGAIVPAPRPHRQRHDGPSTGSGCTEPPRPHRQRHDGFTPKKQRKFFKALRKCGCLSDAARVAGISRNTVRRHRLKWPAFDRKVTGALAMASGELDMIAWQRAVEGVPEIVIRDGKVAWIKIKPSDAILRLLMQGANPEKYGRTGAMPKAAAARKPLRKVASREEVDAAVLKALAKVERRVCLEEEERAAVNDNRAALLDGPGDEQ
jgi:hypothetical protein